MKTRNLLLTLAAAAFAAITINATAGNTYLSPRAAGNRIKTVAGLNHDVNLVDTTGIVLVSPRTTGNQIATVAGTSGDVNSAAACARSMKGTPKAVAECTSHTTMPSCKPVTVASAQ
jgi:hypothetical protein